MAYDLRSYVDEVDEAGELERLSGADWDLELGGITEIVAETDGGLGGPALLFDDVEGYPEGFRVLTNTFGSIERSRIALRLPAGLGPIELLDEWRRTFTDRDPIDPVRVDGDAPVFDTVDTGSDVDVTKFPVPKWHEQDGGRYVGSGCTVVTRDPETGWVNLGVYRSMVLDDGSVSLLLAPGKDARVMMEKYHARGESCPVAMAVGLDPHTWIASTLTAGREEGEYGIAGWIRGEGIPVVEGRETGLPIPANAEIVLEGEIPPLDERNCVDGPHGEWPGYATPAHERTPVIDVAAISHREDPILLGQPPLKPPALYTPAIPIRTAGGIWNQLEGAGISGITGVWPHVFERPFFLAISVDEEYAGHAKQVGTAACTVPNGVYGGRYVVVVDDDVDVTSLPDVIWAMCTRCRVEDLEVIEGLYTSPVDPLVEDEHHPRSSRLVVDATRPFDGEFPDVNRFSDDYRAELVEKWNLDEVHI